MDSLPAITLERVVVCEHCKGPGAEAGWLGDEHIDLVECIEALRDQVIALQSRVTELEARQVPQLRQAA